VLFDTICPNVSIAINVTICSHGSLAAVVTVRSYVSIRWFDTFKHAVSLTSYVTFNGYGSIVSLDTSLSNDSICSYDTSQQFRLARYFRYYRGILARSLDSLLSELSVSLMLFATVCRHDSLFSLVSLLSSVSSRSALSLRISDYDLCSCCRTLTRQSVLVRIDDTDTFKAFVSLAAHDTVGSYWLDRWRTILSLVPSRSQETTLSSLSSRSAATILSKGTSRSILSILSFRPTGSWWAPGDTGRSMASFVSLAPPMSTGRPIWAYDTIGFSGPEAHYQIARGP
jgi:hypothetical protein